MMNSNFLSSDYFYIGKYGVSCCTADAGFVGFIVEKDDIKIKNDAWYEIEGVFESGEDLAGYKIMVIKITNIKEIDGSSEEQYVYPCYSYGDGSCSQILKYNFKY